MECRPVLESHPVWPWIHHMLRFSKVPRFLQSCSDDICCRPFCAAATQAIGSGTNVCQTLFVSCVERTEFRRNLISELLINIFHIFPTTPPPPLPFGYLFVLVVDFRSDSAVTGWKLPAPCGNMFIKCRKMHLPRTQWHTHTHTSCVNLQNQIRSDQSQLFSTWH